MLMVKKRQKVLSKRVKIFRLTKKGFTFRIIQKSKR